MPGTSARSKASPSRPGMTFLSWWTGRKTTPCGYGPRVRGTMMVSGGRGKLSHRYCRDKRKAFAHASAAKQSIVRLSKKLDCFAALAMTTSMGIRPGQHTVRVLAARCVRGVKTISAFPMRRAWGMPGADAPAASHAK